MALTICEETGKPLYETTEDVNHPVDYSFEAVKNFVHSPDVHFEELQHCCLRMSTEIEQLRLAEEGAKEAFEVIVQDKHDLLAECKRLRQLLDSAHDQIRRQHAA